MENVQKFPSTRIALDRKEKSTSPESRLYVYLPPVLIFKASVSFYILFRMIRYDSQKSTKIFYLCGINRLAYLVEEFHMSYVL